MIKGKRRGIPGMTQEEYFEKIREMFELGYAYAYIGKILGKDHTTIIHACKKMGLVRITKGFTRPCGTVADVFFYTDEKLLLYLWQMNWPNRKIEEVLGLAHGTVNEKIYQCKFNLETLRANPPHFNLHEQKKLNNILYTTKYDQIVNEPINLGKKCYMDYVRSAGISLKRVDKEMLKAS